MTASPCRWPHEGRAGAHNYGCCPGLIDWKQNLTGPGTDMTDTAFTTYAAPDPQATEALEQDTTPAPPTITAEAATNADLQEIPVAAIRVDPAFNPRKRFIDEEIAEFAERIRKSGWLSPPLVRPDPYGDGFLLVAGERRLRAIRHLGWTTVQATIKAMD